MPFETNSDHQHTPSNPIERLRIAEEKRNHVYDSAVQNIKERLQPIAEDIERLGIKDFIKHEEFKPILDQMGIPRPGRKTKLKPAYAPKRKWMKPPTDK
jgi:hypothetical protein